MCGRFALGIPRKRLAEHFGLGAVPDAPARYNIAPGQLVEAVCRSHERQERHMRLLRWGLVPGWARDPAHKPLINARSETAAEKPSFKNALRYRRCLLPASGFYEWKRDGAKRRPWFFAPSGDGPLALAAIWETRVLPGDEFQDTCAILTCPANGLMAPVHDRMPVLIGPELFAAWLDPNAQKPAEIAAMMRPVPDGALRCWPVSSLVNAAAHDGPDLVRPLAGLPG